MLSVYTSTVRYQTFFKAAGMLNLRTLNQGVPAQQLLLQQQMANLSLGGSQGASLPSLQQQQQQEVQQQRVQLMQQERAAAAAAAQMDPSYIYNLQVWQTPADIKCRRTLREFGVPSQIVSDWVAARSLVKVDVALFKRHKTRHKHSLT